MVAVDNAYKDDIPSILNISVERIPKVDAPKVVAALYSKLIEITVPDIEKVKIVQLKTEWYEKFEAAGGSRLYWILKLAREKAARGESVEDLKRAFDTSMTRWLTQDEDQFEFLFNDKKDPE